MVTHLATGDVLTLKKRHPCGSRQWRVERLGVDIGIRCVGCQHYVFMDRSPLERRIRDLYRVAPYVDTSFKLGLE